MNELTYTALCLLAGYTVAQAENLGLCRLELINQITNKLNLAV